MRGVLTYSVTANAATYYVPIANNADTAVGTCVWNGGTSQWDCDSLRIAIDYARSAGGGDIVLDAGTYKVEIPGVEDTNAAGDFDFSGGTYTLTGDSKTTTFVDATKLARTAAPDRVIDVRPFTTLTISDVQLRNGLAKSNGLHLADTNSNLTVKEDDVQEECGRAYVAGEAFLFFVALWDKIVDRNGGNGICNSARLGRS